MNLTSKKSTRSALALVLMISVGVHLVGLLIFGVMKIAEVVMREEVTFEAPPPPPPVEEIPEFEVNLEQRNEESSPPRPNPITVDSPDVALPALDIDVNVDSYSSYGRGSGGFGNGMGSGGAGIREMAITANLFGTEVTATKLGVILDISFSTHRAIDKVVNEINKEFKDAIIVLVPGCVIGTHDSTIYPLQDFKKGTKAHKVSKLSTETFTEKLLERNKEFDKIWGKLEKDERGYILFAENPKNKQTGNGGTNDAMEFLRDEGVDTIYWFADFQDGILSAPLDELIKSMKRGRITVIMHDFVAPLGSKNKEGKQNSALLKLQQKLADETDGKFFLKEL
ncbi:MAG: hypothetical protein ACPGJU_01310 [Coraliomargarita sp.]